MMKKLSIRLRLTMLSILLLTTCCVGLTIILNLSAYHMADVIEAAPTIPSTQINPQVGLPSEFEIEQINLSERSQMARDMFLHQSIIYMTLVVAVGGSLTYYLSGKALKPLQELSSQMKNRTVHNLSEDLPMPQSSDEIADLTYSFNEMSSKLDEAFAMQKRFSQSAAHELRTPLTVLKTKVEVFKKKKEHTSEEYDKLLSVILTQTNRLAGVVKDLLDLTHMDVLACNEKVELKSILTDVVEELSCLAKEKNIVLTIRGNEQSVSGSPSLLHRAFYNLVENAIKYNVEGGAVDISIDSLFERGIVTVTDTGIGVPEELHELIFEPFFRVDKSRSRKMGGTGLGLANVKAIIDKHHGAIDILKSPTGGTIFKITI